MKRIYQIITVFLISYNVTAQISTNVYTPYGSLVPDTYIRAEQVTAADILYINGQLTTQYPNAQKIQEATITYNCHAYAWYISEGGSPVWMGLNSNPTSIYWTDNSYTEVTNPSEATKVSYASDNHSAITTFQSDIFISKWGLWPLMKHQKNDCPYNSSNLKYYKRSVPKILGPSELCYNQSGTFSINAPLTSITWSANGLTASSGSNSEFTASPLMYAGMGYVRATFTVGQTEYTLQKDLELNGYVPIEGPDVVYLSERKAYFTIDASSGIQWRINGVVVTPSIPNSLIVSLNNYYPGSILITCTVTTSCGTFEASKSLSIIDDDEFLMYPNPATDVLTVSLSTPAQTGENATMVQTVLETVEPYSIQLWNERLGLVKTVETDQSTVQIPLSSLQKGMYYVHVVRDKKMVKKQILWIK